MSSFQKFLSPSVSSLNIYFRRNNGLILLSRGLHFKRCKHVLSPPSSIPSLQTSLFHTSCIQNKIAGLTEFFDDKENWGVKEVKVGRSWRKEELRIKSNSDLHKLWYVLLKEKNMLLTMEEECKRKFKVFPNPERIDKVEDSMENLEAVVRERDRAYMLLETGETGERPADHIIDSFGRKVYRRFAEYTIPDYMNPRYMHRPTILHPVRTHFSRLLREKEEAKKTAQRFAKIRYIGKLFSLYPDIDVEALKHKYPDMDIESIRKMKISRGSHENNQC